MAGNLPVPNGAELKIVWGLNGVPAALNILHYAHPTAASMSQALADAASTHVKNAFSVTALNAQIFAGVSLMRVEIRHMDANSDPWFIGAGTAVPGTAAGNPLPAATSFVVSVTTGMRGRSFNGRIYLWGWTEDANDTLGGITAAGSTAALGFCQQLGSLGASLPGYSLGVLSRFTTPPLSTVAIERNPPLLTAANGFVVKDSRWDVQRRRAVPGI